MKQECKKEKNMQTPFLLMQTMKQGKLWLAAVMLIVLALCSGCENGADNWLFGNEEETNIFSEGSKEAFTLETIPEFSGKPYVALNQNKPDFTKEEKENTDFFESYSELDALGRCGVAYANLCKEGMPTGERGEIGHIRPSGWHTVKYKDLVEGLYLYNRCHLIGFQLAGENANEKNLITGTRYFNVEGMLPFENEVADYIKQTPNHVLYRVTPVYKGENLVADGVIMEAYSVEDDGRGICFHVFVYNCQPGIFIDYATGDSRMMTEEEKAGFSGAKKDQSAAYGDGKTKEDEEFEEEKAQYILNKSTKKIHRPGCASVGDIKGKNKESYTGSKEELIKQGYSPCQRCSP